MKKIACLYSIVRYVPDPVRNEARNIGVIIQSSDVGYVGCKFLKNLRVKLGSAATSVDLRILNAYFEEFNKNFEPYSKFPSTGYFFKENIESLGQQYLRDLANQGMGRIQFTEPQGCLVSNPEAELTYLFDICVGKEKAESEQIAKHSRLKTEIRGQFKKRNLLVIPEKGITKGFKVDAKISGGKSQVDHLIDFILENGTLYLLEAIDMRKKDERGWLLETYEAAFKFDDLKQGENGKKLESYSIVALSDLDEKSDYLKILNSYSTVFRYDKDKEKNKFFHEMHKIVEGGNTLF